VIIPNRVFAQEKVREYFVITIDETKAAERFFASRETWNAVLSKSKDDTVFLTWENIVTSVQFIDSKNTMRLLFAMDEDKILGIAPLRQSSYKLFNGLSYTVIEPLAYGNSDYTGIILTERETECLQSFVKYLFQYKNWDFIYLYDIPETSILSNILIQSRQSFPRFTIEKGRICPYLPLPDSVDDLLEGLSAKFRKNLRRSIKALEANFGKIELKQFDELFSLEEGMAAFFDLHQKRWLSKGNEGVYHTDESRQKTMNSVKFLAEKGWLQLYFLTVDNKPIATQFCLEYKQKLHYGLGGFDPAFSSYSVGNIIILKVIEQSIQRKIKEYDFMKGAESYKFNWTNLYRHNLRITFVNRKITSKVLKVGINAARKTGLKRSLYS
jgi:CelD/BcsL family acetyltransferase involved in cellulose biosynthesis